MKLEISIACLVLCSLTVLTEAGTKVQQCKGIISLQTKCIVYGYKLVSLFIYLDKYNAYNYIFSYLSVCLCNI